MTGLEFAAWRHLLGLTLEELAHVLGVNPRTVRAWESGRDPIPASVHTEVQELAEEHANLVELYKVQTSPLRVTRDKAASVAARPRGWYVAALARALAAGAALDADWV